jgi:hypothetical protein
VSSCQHDGAAPDQGSIKTWAEGYEQTIQQFGLDERSPKSLPEPSEL